MNSEVMKYKFVYFKVYIYCLILSTIGVTILSTSTSPIYAEPQMVDAGIFLTIGKYWTEGLVPYINLWDCKGPFQFLINYLGFILTGTRTGVYMMEIMANSFSLYISYFIFRTELSSTRSALYVLLVLLSGAAIWSDGSFVEEYCLPFLMLSFYLAYLWVKKSRDHRDCHHPPLYAFVYGVTFGICLFSRLTNALGLSGLILFVTITLIVQKKYKDLSLNIIFFLIGFCVISLPFIVYFYYKNALSEMWYGTLLYGIEYANNSHSELPLLVYLQLFIRSFYNCFLLFTLSIIALILKIRRSEHILWGLSTGLLLLWYINSNCFPHYGYLSLPFLCIFLLDLHLISEETIMSGRIIKRFVPYFFIFIVVAACAHGYVCLINGNKSYPKLAMYKELLSKIPSKDMEYFVAYNSNLDIYYYLNIKPCYRFFVLQEFQPAFGKSYSIQLQKEYSSLKAKWILIDTSVFKPIMIKNLLAMHYFVFERKNELVLYKKRQE